MKNTKILAGTLVIALLATTGAYAANTETSSTKWIFWKQKIELTDEQKSQMEEVKALFEKVKNWETLTADEQTKLDELKASMPQRWEREWGKWFHGKWKGPRWWEWFGWKWAFWVGFDNLTDEEETQLESMTDEQKQAFFEAKRQEQEVKMEAREVVIDKLLNGETLTDEQKVIVEEIKAQRAEHKEKKAEMESVRVLFEKVKNGETLSSDEQTKLDEFKANIPQRHMK